MATSTTRYDRTIKENADKLASGARDAARTVENEASDLASSAMRSASDMAETVTTKLKNVGVDTDTMAAAAKEQASELQRLIGNELQARPMRALGIAAAVGVFVGLMTAR